MTKKKVKEILLKCDQIHHHVRHADVECETYQTQEYWDIEENLGDLQKSVYKCINKLHIFVDTKEDDYCVIFVEKSFWDV